MGESWTWVLYSRSWARIIMLTVLPKERFMRGGHVIMRACGSMKRLPFFP